MDQLPLIGVALVVLLAIAGAAYASGSRRSAPIAGALLAGPVAYFLVGVLVPRVTGEGHFFSVPFGGFNVSDANLLLSAAAWCAACWALLYLIAGARRR